MSRLGWFFKMLGFEEEPPEKDSNLKVTRRC
jgi:hypothetical protein